MAADNNSLQIKSQIEAKRWWQGSLIERADLAHLTFFNDSYSDVPYWVIASQTCNLYSVKFDDIPVFEIVAAYPITKDEELRHANGDHPRILGSIALSPSGEQLRLRIDILKRRWLPRELLATLPPSDFALIDEISPANNSDFRCNWCDNFAGWLGRSYTRVTLPDALNIALSKSKIESILRDKLTKHDDKLFGIYVSFESDAEDSTSLRQGEMPPPYNFSILLIVKPHADPAEMRTWLIEKLFKDKIKDPTDSSNATEITRAMLARRYQLRIVEAGVEAESTEEMRLARLDKYYRYSIVDYLSDSSMAVPT